MDLTNERPVMGDELIPGSHGWSLTRVDIRLIESHIETQIRWIGDGHGNRPKMNHIPQ